MTEHIGARVAGRRFEGWRKALTRIVLGVSVSMTLAEFIEVQKLSDEQLQTRFALPSSCQPAVTALTTDAMASTVLVAVECRGKSAPPAGGRPTPVGRQPQSPKGS